MTEIAQASSSTSMENFGIKVALSLGFDPNNGLIKTQPPDLGLVDQADRSGAAEQYRTVNTENQVTSIEISAPPVAQVQMPKIERVDLDYVDGKTPNDSNIASQPQCSEPPSDNFPTEDFVVTYNDADESRENGMERPYTPSQAGEGREEPPQLQPVPGIFSSTVEEPSAENPRTAFDSLNNNSQTSLVSLENAEGLQEGNTCDEIHVVDEMADYPDDGSLIKNYHHGTMPETFLSQMHFFGGRSWARAQKRGRGSGNNQQKDLTDIALSLIESDQQSEAEPVSSTEGTSHASATLRNEETASMSESLHHLVGQTGTIEARNAMCLPVKNIRGHAGRGRGGKKARRGKGFGKRVVKTTSETVETAGAEDDYISNEEDTLAAIKASLEDMQQTGPSKSKPVTQKAKSRCTKKLIKSKTAVKTSSLSEKGASSASVSNDLEETYESNDEDTQAAIKASLEEIRNAKKIKKRKAASLTAFTSKAKVSKDSEQSYLSKPAGEEESNNMDNKWSESDFEQSRGSTWSGFKSKLKPSSRGKSKTKRFGLARAMFQKKTDEETNHAPSFGKRSSKTEVGSKNKSNVHNRKKQQEHNVKGAEDTSPGPSPSKEDENRRDFQPGPEISDFDNVVDAFLHGHDDEELKSELPLLPCVKKTRSSRRRTSFSMPTEKYEKEAEYSMPDLRSTVQPSMAPFVKLKKLTEDVHLSSSRCSFTPQSLKPKRKMPLSVSHAKQSDTSDRKIFENVLSSPQLSQNLSSSVPSTTSSVIYNANEPGRSKDQEQSLTKSVGSMMSHLFGNNLAEECPNGFVVNVSLEVSKKNQEPSSTDNRAECCKGKNPELCPCLQKIPENRLAAVLKEKVENRRDLTVRAKGTLLATILSFMQELETFSNDT